MVTVVIPTDWTSIMTASGTVGAAVAALGIVIWATGESASGYLNGLYTAVSSYRTSSTTATSS